MFVEKMPDPGSGIALDNGQGNQPPVVRVERAGGQHDDEGAADKMEPPAGPVRMLAGVEGIELGKAAEASGRCLHRGFPRCVVDGHGADAGGRHHDDRKPAAV